MGGLTPERWKRVKELHGQALELPAEEREAFVERECGGDLELLREVLELLGAEVEERFLHAPAPSCLNGPGGKAESPPELPDLAGRTLGDFRLLERIGQGGGGGAVYRAHQESLGRDVAIKILPALATLVPRHLERFKREAAAAARLKHEGVVPIHAFGEQDGVFYYAMDLVEGGDLHRALEAQRNDERAPLPAARTPEGARELARLVAEVAEAVQFAHEHHVVHRDIKPQNLMLGENGRLQLVDFGLARDENLGSITFSGEIRGTPYYMSPEQARLTKERVDHRTDVYSLGVVLYELLTLHRPFEGRTSLEILDRISHSEARRVRALNPLVPVELETICHHAMEKEVARRYASARELAEDLRRFLAGQPILARAPGPVDRLRRLARRRRQPIAVFTAAALALVLGVGGFDRWRVHAERSRWPVLSVSVAAEGGAGSAQVALLRLVPEHPVPEPARALGPAPIAELPVEPGYYRILVSVEGYGTAELTRDLALGDEPLELEVALRSTAEVTRDMVRLDGGRLTFARYEDHGCPYDGDQVDVPPFWIDPTEVSFGEYRAFLAETGRAEPDTWSEWAVSEAPDDFPVVGVSWLEARAYAEWAGKRLPTHAEWELAGSGEEGRAYPWVVDPSDPDAIHGNVEGTHEYPAPRSAGAFEHYLRMVRPVDSDPAARTPEGLYHMFGNVREYTESRWASRDGDRYELHPHERCFLGGAWDELETTGRFRHHGYVGLGGGYASHRIGFRCAKSL